MMRALSVALLATALWMSGCPSPSAGGAPAQTTPPPAFAGGTQSSGDITWTVVDTGKRCVRAPCFSYQATSSAGASMALSGVNTSSLGLSPDMEGELRRAMREGGMTVRGRIVEQGAGASRTVVFIVDDVVVGTE